jgi:GT2 family glycosyltransferase
MSARPHLSVIVPFAGQPAELERLLRALHALELRPGDEVIVADNRPGEAAPRDCGEIKIRPAVGVCSPGFARNRGAAMSDCEWLVFIDSDTEPSASLLDDLFDPPPAPTTAILAGEIVDVAAEPTGAARHGAARALLSQAQTLSRPIAPYAQSANCAVRRTAFAEVGGFAEEARAGEDADLCFRLERAGWQLEPRPQARVAHRARETLPALLTQLMRHGSGAAWLNDRYPGWFPPPTVWGFCARIGRQLFTAAGAAVRGDRATGTTALFELAEACAFEFGRLLSNRARRED